MKLFSRASPLTKGIINIIGIGFVLFSMGVSISYGATTINLHTVWQAIFHFNESVQAHQVIWELRIPRALAALLTGAFLAMSGAVMQGMTRNPLASPSIMGVTDGAAFMLVIILAFYPAASSIGFMFATFFGAGIAVTMVFLVGSFSKNGLTPIKLALAGVAIGTLLRSVSSILSLHFQLEKDIGFWLAGGLDGADWNAVTLLFFAGAAGVILALSISKSITVLSLGDDLSTGLGQNNTLIKITGMVVVLILTGAAVSVAGAVGFVGLIIPHITRFIIGTDYRWIIPTSAVLGALLLVNADLIARLINAPFETPVGSITSIIGVPFFLYLARGSGGDRR